MRAKITLVLLIVISFIFMLINRDNFLINNADGVLLNEVIPDNFYLKADSLGNYYDIIEIYNNSEESVNLSGYGLSDEAEQLHKWTFPNVVIESGEYLLVYMAGEEAEMMNDLTDDLYCNFKTKSSGEKIILSNEKGRVVSTLVFEQMKTDMSYGRSEEGYAYFYQGTPGMANQGLIIDDIRTYMLDIPLIPSFKSGIYNEPIELEFESIGNFDIRYTLDCSEPDSSSMLYEYPIYIDYTSNLDIRISNIDTSFFPFSDLESERVEKGLVVKAQYFDGDLPVGDVFTGTYFIWEEGSDRYSFDVVSLTTDDDNLYSSEKGIFVIGDEFMAAAPEYPDGATPANYNQKGREWEREVSFELFDSEGNLAYSQNVGLRVAGGWSRAYNKKSLRIYARDGYGSESIDFEIFEGLTDSNGDLIDSFDKLGIRIGGNDYEYLIFRDLLGDSIAPDTLDYQDYKPIIMFINGEYHGIYNIREALDESYIENHYGIAEEDVSMVKHFEGAVLNYAGNDEEYQRYLELLEFMDNNDLANPVNYDYVESMIDIDNLIDYYLTEAYVDNKDWLGNNIKVWRYTGEVEDDEKDGKYRFLLYDLDFGFALYSDYNQVAHDPFTFIENNQNSVMYPNLIVNEEFREELIIRMCDLLNTNFSSDNVNGELDKLLEIYEPELMENRNRWKFWAYDSLEKFEETQVTKVRDFIERRPKYMYGFVSELYGLDQAVEITVETNNGLIEVNDDYQLVNNTLKYFSDYEIKLEALNNDEYQFDHWEIINSVAVYDKNNPILEVYPEAGMRIEAIYMKKN